MSQQAKHLYEFGPFRLDAAERLLLRDGLPLPLTNKAFDTLLVLVENCGHIVEKDDLMQRVWPDAVVEESTLAQNIFRLRRALGEDPGEQQYIETIPKHGYRFVAPVTEFYSDRAALIFEKHTRSRIVTEEEEHIEDQGEVEQVIAQKTLRSSSQKNKPSRLRLIPILPLVSLLVVATAAFFYFWTPKTTQIGTTTPIRSIAVLPFKPLLADSRDESLEIGMADTLITRLSSIRQLTVRPTSAVRKYSTLEQEPVAAGRELRVEAVLEGSIQWDEGRRVRVTTRLWRVEDHSLLWTDSCVEQCTDIFALQDTISERVARALTTTLTGSEQKLLAKHQTESPEAYQHYIKGRFFWNKRTEEGLRNSIEDFRHAIRLDPRYALAYVGLADSHLVLKSLSLVTPQQAHAEVEPSLRQALEIDDSLGEAHTALAWVRFTYDWNWPDAEREFRRASELQPNDATTHQWYAEFLSAMGRFDESLAEIRRAQQLEPHSPIINVIAAQIHFFARQYDQAIEQCRKTLELDPNFYIAHDYLGWAYKQKGRYEEAIAAFKKAQQIEDSTLQLCEIGNAYAAAGNREDAQKVLHEVIESSKRKHAPQHSYRMARIYATLRERDAAFRWLKKAFNEREENWFG